MISSTPLPQGSSGGAVTIGTVPSGPAVILTPKEVSQAIFDLSCTMAEMRPFQLCAVSASTPAATSTATATAVLRDRVIHVGAPVRHATRLFPSVVSTNFVGWGADHPNSVPALSIPASAVAIPTVANLHVLLDAALAASITLGGPWALPWGCARTGGALWWHEQAALPRQPALVVPPLHITC